jgi:hypothetical protein
MQPMNYGKAVFFWLLYLAVAFTPGILGGSILTTPEKSSPRMMDFCRQLD